VHDLLQMYHRLGKSFWKKPMELLGDVAHVESRFGPFHDGFSVMARLVHGLHQTYHRVRNHFGCTKIVSEPMVLLAQTVHLS
jgi:hypothetical protein